MNIFLTDLTLCDFVKDTKRAIYYKKSVKKEPLDLMEKMPFVLK